LHLTKQHIKEAALDCLFVLARTIQGADGRLIRCKKCTTQQFPYACVDAILPCSKQFNQLSRNLFGFAQNGTHKYPQELSAGCCLKINYAVE
jgi:hypothetical protein